MPERDDPRGRSRLVTPLFARITAAGLAYFIAVAVLVPVIPRYVGEELGGGTVAVGASIGVFFLVAALVRPFIGAFGDRRGSRTLMVGGAVVTGLSYLLYGFAGSVPAFIAVRALSGVGEGALFIGASSTINDLAPAERRGEALSYWSVAVYGGFGLGPVIGEAVALHGYPWVWATSAFLCGVAAFLGLAAPHGVCTTTPFELRSVLHRAGLLPGAVIGLGLLGYAGFLGFVPLYAKELGMGGVGSLLLLYAVFILAIRLRFPWLVDRLGSVRAGSIALVATGSGLFVIAAMSSPIGLYIGTLVLAAGMSMAFPALMTLAIELAPVEQRRAVIGTFTGFFDLAQGFGAVFLGLLVSPVGYRGAFAISGLAAFAGLGLLRRGTTANMVGAR